MPAKAPSTVSAFLASQPALDAIGQVIASTPLERWIAAAKAARRRR